MRVVLQLLLRRAEFRTFVRWRRQRALHKIKWKAFRGWVDAMHASRQYVIVVQRAARLFLAKRRARAHRRIALSVMPVLPVWIARMRRLRWKRAAAAERCVVAVCACVPACQ